MQDTAPHPATAPKPWWRFGMVWFVLAGPAIVVVAGFVTMALAYRNADEPLSQGHSINVPVPGPKR